VLNIPIQGDSKFVIDWINSKNNMQNMHLSPIIEKIKRLEGIFSKNSFHHIHRELNARVDELSKQSLSMQAFLGQIKRR